MLGKVLTTDHVGALETGVQTGAGIMTYSARGNRQGPPAKRHVLIHMGRRIRVRVVG